MVDNKQLNQFLLSLGLTEDQTKIYLTLIANGPLTALDLARKTAIPRTTVYRLIDQLNAEKLVETLVEEHTTLVSAVSPDQLELLLKSRQADVDRLTRLFPQVQLYLNQQLQSHQPDTQVRFYRGISGIQQMAWNELNADKEIVGFTQSKFELAVGKKFALNFYEELFLEKITMRDIFSDRYIESMGGIQNLGQEVHPQFSKSFISRYLPPDKLDILHTMDVYNDVLAFYDWQGNDIFGVEITNPKVAKMQKQIFEILWNIATPEVDLVSG